MKHRLSGMFALTRTTLCAAALAVVFLCTHIARAESRLDLTALQPLAPLAELVVSGENRDNVPRAVTIRIDDHPGADYADRINEERMMPPGKFTLRLRLALLRTPRQRQLEMPAAFRATAFAPDGGDLAFEPLKLDVPPNLPLGVQGWFFGPAAAIPLAGFDAVVPGDSRISGPHVEQIERPGGDPVLAYGVRLTLFKTSLEPGRWRLTLWTEDPGAWETLPVMLARRVRVNGTDLSFIKRDYAGWVADRYLAGRTREADPAQPPFASIGALRGDRIKGVVTVGADGVLTLELAGFPQTSTHLAALTAEPADLPPAGEAVVEAVRAAWFAERWPVLVPPPPAPDAKGLSIVAVDSDDGAVSSIKTDDASAASVKIQDASVKRPGPSQAQTSAQAPVLTHMPRPGPAKPQTQNRLQSRPQTSAKAPDQVTARPAAQPPIQAAAQMVTAPGGVAYARFNVLADHALAADIAVTWDGKPLPARLFWGQWRWRRPGAGAAGLVFSAGQLRAVDNGGQIPLRSDLPRPLVLIVNAGTDAAPGPHRGRLRLHTPQGDAEIAFSVNIAAVTRPAPAARTGAFLGFAPQLLGTPEWSKDQGRRDARAQAACDLNTLSGLGLTAVTAPLSDPDVSTDDLVEDIRTTLAHFPAPVIGYETLRNYAFRHQPAETAAMLAKVNAAIKAAGLPPVIWSIADEPGYAGIVPTVHALAEAIHQADPDALLAGHLNDPRDLPLLPDLAMVTLNPGIGADASNVAALRKRGIRPWLYNMPSLRLAGGAYLWRSGADGFLQWHARMPTADAFDPTDGREGDVQFLWPTPGVCAPPDLDEDLLKLVDAAEDLRWFAWLDASADQNKDAAILRRRLVREVPDTWAQAAALPPDKSAIWRNSIAKLAQTLKP